MIPLGPRVVPLIYVNVSIAPISMQSSCSSKVKAIIIQFADKCLAYFGNLEVFLIKYRTDECSDVFENCSKNSEMTALMS